MKNAIRKFAVFCAVAIGIGVSGLATSLLAQGEQLVQVYWTGGAGGSLQYDFEDGSLDSLAVVVPDLNISTNAYIVAGCFGHAIGLMANGDENQSQTIARSITLAIVNPANYSVKCYPLTNGWEPDSTKSWGVTSNDSDTNLTIGEVVIVDDFAPWIFIAGGFGCVGDDEAISENIGMYEDCNSSCPGWLDGASKQPFATDGPVTSISWDSSNHVLDVSGDFTHVYDSGTTGGTGTVSHAAAGSAFWNPRLLLWNVYGH